MEEVPVEIPAQVRRELILLIDRKHRHAAQRLGEPGAARNPGYRQKWIELLAEREEIADEATLNDVKKRFLVLPEMDPERAKALRTVTWSDLRRARAA